MCPQVRKINRIPKLYNKGETATYTLVNGPYDGETVTMSWGCDCTIIFEAKGRKGRYAAEPTIITNLSVLVHTKLYWEPAHEST